MLPKLAAFRDRLAHLPGFDLERFDRLETYAGALFAAENRWRMAVKPDDRLGDLVAEGARLRELLRQVAKVLVLRKLVDVRQLRNLSAKRNAAALSQDLLILSRVLEPLLPEVRGSSGVTKEELDTADRLSTLLSRTNGRRRLHSRDDIRKAADLRVRAFTRLAWTYEDTRRAIVYLCGRDQDPEKVIPTLYGRRQRRRNAIAEAPAPPPGSSVPLLPAAGASSE